MNLILNKVRTKVIVSHRNDCTMYKKALDQRLVKEETSKAKKHNLHPSSTLLAVKDFLLLIKKTNNTTQLNTGWLARY